MKNLADDLWLLTYPLTVLGADIQRHVAILRLASGELVIHSTGPFSSTDVANINALGTPRWLLDVMARHDTFAKEGRAAFPEATYLAPEGFSDTVGFPTQPLLPPPAEWGDEVQVLLVGGVPSMKEHAVFHRPSRTLIVADLLFDFGPETPAWTKLLSYLIVGTKEPGMSRPFKASIEDKQAFNRSMRAILAWDFDRIVVGHGQPLETNGKALLSDALHEAGYLAGE